MDKIIATVDVTREILTKYGINPKQRYGQNFLVVSKIPELVSNQNCITKDTLVIEIGAGLGSMTQFLIQKAKRVIVYEIDTKLCEILKETFNNVENLEINNCDFLKVNLDEIDTVPYKNTVIVSNLPYYITSEILIKILTFHKKIDCICMMQKEVAHRILERKDINEVVLCAHLFSEVTKVAEVSKNDFFPKPNIDSTVLFFKKNDKETYLFEPIYQSLYGSRRKNILNGLKNINGHEMCDDYINYIFSINKLTGTERIDNLSFDKIENLYFSIKDSIFSVCPAKINIGLKIKEKRHRMHSFESFFYPIYEYIDFIEVYCVTSNDIIIDSNVSCLNSKENTVYKILSKLQKELKLSYGFYVKLTKKIPLGSGMGGGSSDAGTCLRILNKIYNLTSEKIINIALSAGTDSVYFLNPIPSRIISFDNYEEVKLPLLEIKIITDDSIILTKDVFEQYDNSHQNVKNDDEYIKFNLKNLKNDLESSILTLYPHLQNKLYKYRVENYDYVQFSGTGPTIVCIKYATKDENK